MAWSLRLIMSVLFAPFSTPTSRAKCSSNPGRNGGAGAVGLRFAVWFVLLFASLVTTPAEAVTGAEPGWIQTRALSSEALTESGGKAHGPEKIQRRIQG
jgi:hypothetical protein